MNPLVFAYVFAAAMLLSGIARFGAYSPRPPLWLDLLFLVSTAAVVTSLVAWFIRRMYADSHGSIRGSRGRDLSDGE